MMEYLSAILEAFEAKMKAYLDSVASWIDAHHDKTEANHWG
jgi:hypothetical protein